MMGAIFPLYGLATVTDVGDPVLPAKMLTFDDEPESTGENTPSGTL